MKTTFKGSLLTFSFCLNFLITLAQERALKIEAKVNTNRSVDFNFQKTDPDTYTVVINFTTFSNALNPGTLFSAREIFG